MNFYNAINYDDSVVREQVIKFYDDVFNIRLNQTNPSSKLIDLTGYTSYYFGVEVEHGKWVGDFWTNQMYSMISGLGFPTINIPMRKEKYWKPTYHFYNRLINNHQFDKNVFVRTNKDFTQFIVVRPEVILDEKKNIKSEFIPKNSNIPERFMSFREEHVETYNFIENRFILKSHE